MTPWFGGKIIRYVETFLRSKILCNLMRSKVSVSRFSCIHRTFGHPKIFTHSCYLWIQKHACPAYRAFNILVRSSCVQKFIDPDFNMSISRIFSLLMHIDFPQHFYNVFISSINIIEWWLWYKALLVGTSINNKTLMNLLVEGGIKSIIEAWSLL